MYIEARISRTRFNKPVKLDKFPISINIRKEAADLNGRVPENRNCFQSVLE